MAENEIRVVISGVASDLRRALEGAKGDLSGLAVKIKEVPNEIKVDVRADTLAALGRLRELKDAAKDVPNDIRIQADADTGIAQAKLRLLERQARQTEEAIARAQLGSLISGGGGGGGGGGILSGVAAAIPGGVLPGGGQAIAAGSPAIAAGVGALTAVAGSAGAGILGAGALATSVAGVGGVGLGSMLAVIMGAKAGISQVTTAMDALEKATANYGASSKQAAQAQQNLNTAMADAGPEASAIAKQLGALGDQWTQVSKPATQALDRVIISGLKVVEKLMPTVAAIAQQAFDAIGAALKPVFEGLSSPAFKRVLTDLGDAFARLQPPLIGAFSNLMRAFLNTAVAAAPYLIQIAQAFERWTQSFANALAPGAHLSALIGGLVSQLHSWWELAGALGHLMVTIFSAGAGSGQGLVTMLTDIVRQWNAWLDTKQGQDLLKGFFRDAATLVKQFAVAFGPLALALADLLIKLMPSFTVILKALTPVLTVAAGLILLVANAIKHSLILQIVAVSALLVAGAPLIIGLVLVGFTLSHLKEIVAFFSQAWHDAWAWVQQAFKDVLSFILGGFSSLLGAFKSFFDAVNIKLPLVGHIFGSAGSAVSKALGEAQSSIDAFRATLAPTAAAAKTDTAQIASSHEDMARRVKGAISDMSIATGKGISEVEKLLVDELKKFGVGQSITLLGAVAGNAITGVGAKSGLPAGRAGGGLIQVGRPGERGPDRIPMNIGGVPIRVGAGEQVAVFNHQQQTLAQRLIPGGLAGLFAATAGARHDMATGGIVTASQFGGPGDPGTGSVGYRGDNLYAHPDSYAELNMGTALGGLPYMAALNVTRGAKTIRVLKRDIGAGGPGLGGHVRAIDLWFQAADALGLGGLANVMVNGGAGVNVNIAGGGGVGRITAPKWTGPGGALGQIGQAALAKVTAAANTLLAAQTPSVNVAPGPASGTGGTTMFEGVTMAKWIADELAWATQHGWHGQPTSGYRPGFDPHATGGSEHALTRYPGGAVDFGGYTDPAAYATKLALVELAARLGYPGPRLLMPIGFHDDGHLSGTGHAQGGLVPGFAAGAVHAHTARAARRPPAPARHHHSRSKSKYQPFIPKDALKGLLSPDQLRPDRMAAGYARQVTVADQTLQNLLAAQALTPVDDPELVTLTDADVAALDPTGALGYQAGDQIVNRDGMSVGRYFGPGGAIQGGSFHPGASTRLAQIAAILANRNPRYGALRSEMGAQGAAIAVDSRAIGNRVGRRARIERYLHKSVQRAGVIKAELDVLKSKNLAQALRQALSKQAIAGRLSGLRGHLRTVSEELTAERHSQSLLIPIQQDPTHTNELQAQAQNLRDSIAIESQLGQGGAGAVQRARSAIFAHGLQSQLAALQKTNMDLGGRALVAGTGGAIGQITGQIATITTDSVARRNTLADFQQTELIPAAAEIASYVKERADIGKLANIQVRDPTAAAAAAVAPAGPDLAALNALLATQLSQTQQALALSQSQFGVLQGFAPLLAGRLVGSFQSGIDFVPRTGLALVHRGETIIPDPDGPASNRAAATVHTAHGPQEIVIVMANNDAPLMKIIDARIGQRALRVVSDQSGQRARLLSGVRRS